MLLDIDYFKQFNDHYGHIRGDDCLRTVGKALAGALHRPRDFIARFGGEEFVLVLPETDSEAARQVAERCRSVLREQQISHEKSNVSSLLTISLGVGTAVPASSDRPLDFVAAVDRLLYQAKQAGRDRLVAAQWKRGDDLRRDAVL